MAEQVCEKLPGMRLRELRMAQKLTQTTLASQSGITAKQLCFIERGHVDFTAVRMTTLRKIATALNLTIIDLLQRLEE